MTDIITRKSGLAGRITLTRPKALNAVTYDMCSAIETAIDAWRDDDQVRLIIIDAEGEKAFSAGGDIADLYATGTKGDFAYGRKFWRDEYRMNAKLHEYPKPIVSFLQGFTMGGGMGVGCHASHRVVGDSSQIAMPECGIGLVPDVGGSLLLAQAPGHLGDYFGLSAARMNAGDAIYLGFADHYIPEAQWPDLIRQLETTADPELLTRAAAPAPTGDGMNHQDDIDRYFSGDDLPAILASLAADPSDFAEATLRALSRNSPLAMGCALEISRRLQNATSIREALEQEYRFTYRAMQHGDFLEGIRAQIIDKDRNPRWRHDLHQVPQQAIDAMLAPLGDHSLTFEKGE